MAAGPRTSLHVGAVRVHHVEEWQGNFLPPSAFFMGYDEATFRALAPGLTPQYYRDDADSLYAFLQSWIIEVDGLTVLYDTGAGNAKDRPGIPLFGGLDTPFLTRMAAAGFTPDGFSDYTAFNQAGIPVVAFESTNWEIGDLDGYEQTEEYGSFWHTENDTLAAIEERYPERPMVRLRAFTRLTFEFLKHLNPAQVTVQ